MKKGRLTCQCSTMNLLAPSGHTSARMFLQKEWGGNTALRIGVGDDLNGLNVWTDGTNIYFTLTEHPNHGGYLADDVKHLVLRGDTWETAPSMNWTEVNGIAVRGIWTDGTNIYHSANVLGQYDSGYSHYILKDGAWEPKTWYGLTEFTAQDIWSDGTNIYYSGDNGAYVLNGDTWEEKIWENGAVTRGYNIWSDGENIYNGIYDANGNVYVLNGDTWEVKDWELSTLPTGSTSIGANAIWSDGENIFCSSREDQFVLNGDKWDVVKWSGMSSKEMEYFDGYDIWTDGTYIYRSFSSYSLGKFNSLLLPVAAQLYSRTNGEWVKLDSIG